MTRAALMLLSVFLAASFASCAESRPEPADREVRDIAIEFSRTTVVHSSVLRFRFLDTADRQATLATVRLSGSLGGGRALDEEFVLPVGHVDPDGDLIAELPVADRLWALVEPDPERTFSGHIELSLEDPIGTFAAGEVDSVALRFHAEYGPEVTPILSDRAVYPNQHLKVSGTGFLRPEEGNTWAVVDTGSVSFPDGTSRVVTNARVALVWTGSREEAALPISPAIFGVSVSEFSGGIRFENELETGEVFRGNAQADFQASLRAPRIDALSPESGSRGQKITVEGRGFVHADAEVDSGTYFVLAGTLTPDDPAIAPIVLRDEHRLIISPHRVVDETTVEQEVAYQVDPDTHAVTGLGAVPGVFEGAITPWIFRGDEQQEGEPWEGQFRVLPTKQVVYVKFLDGFTSALNQYGLGVVEDEICARILSVLRRDYDGVNIEFVDAYPDDFVVFTTIEVGGPDPSGLLNFGYDNSFNDGGKDIGNRFLGDYLGGVNRHSADAGYLPYGGVFIESFTAFSARLFPDNRGTAPEFDRVLGPFMPVLGGRPVLAGEWPDGPRTAAIENAIDMIGNLAGHTASHEIGHSLGLAYFPESVEDFEKRFHNDPPGPDLIMDAGGDRPFNERAEMSGQGPTRFSDDNRRYLQAILPLP